MRADLALKRDELIAAGYTPLRLKPLTSGIVPPPRISEGDLAAWQMFADLASSLSCQGLEDALPVRKIISDYFKVEWIGDEVFIPASVAKTWEWCQDEERPWPRDGKPYRMWACVKAAEMGDDYPLVLDSIWRMIGMVGALAFIEKGIDLRDGALPE